MFNLEAISTCVDYGDILEVTASQNRHLFDRWVIVTTERDKETREVCRKYNLEVVLTDDFYHKGVTDEFAKARGINRGLAILSADSWRLHLDADIVLPPTTLQSLEAARLEPTHLYGVDRVMIKSWCEWQKFLKSGYLSHSYHHHIAWPPYAVGSRWASPYFGWVPIGFFQLWHADADEWRGIRQRRYPERHGNACRCDVQFSLLWDRTERELIPEVIAIHLESEAAKMGKNWHGRKTKRFGPDGGKGDCSY